MSEKTNNQTKDPTSMFSSFAGGITGLIMLLALHECAGKKVAIEKYNTINPINAHVEYVNKDTLLDLVYKTGEIFLQTKEGNFVSLDSVMSQEKARIDSIYKSKQDSIKAIYNK